MRIIHSKFRQDKSLLTKLKRAVRDAFNANNDIERYDDVYNRHGELVADTWMTANRRSGRLYVSSEFIKDRIKTIRRTDARMVLLDGNPEKTWQHIQNHHALKIER